MKTSIIVLAGNDQDLTRQCLESVRRHTREPYELIVIDNVETLGLAMGCNQGIKLSTGEYILFLKHDTVVTENWLEPMVTLMESDSQIGMVGPVSNNVSGHQKITVTYQDLSELDGFSKFNQLRNAGCSKRVFRLLSFCLLVSRTVFETIGNFDEQFGLGCYEDDDLCYRAVSHGYHLRIALDSFVHYIGEEFLNPLDTARFQIRLTQNRQKMLDKWSFDVTDHLHRMKAPITISLCMIVKNEEKVLARCLDTVKDIADDIVIVDTGSTDETKHIAAQYNSRVFDFTWIDDFAAARNYAFQKARMEYILWLDADDVILEPDREKLLELKQSFDPAVDIVNMHYVLGLDAQGHPTFSLRRNRLVRRCRNYRWIGAVHEYLEVGGNILNSDISITHRGDSNSDSDRNLKIYENRLNREEEFSPRDLYYYANELRDHQQFEKAAEYYQRFLSRPEGWVEDKIAACNKLADCYAHLKRPEEEYEALLRSFRYDIPRAEFCCRLGFKELQAGKPKHGAFWYKLATDLEMPTESWGPINHAYWTWLPHLQLCVCYDRLGQYELAYKHNELARQWAPDNPNVLHNKRYLENKLGIQTS